MTGRSLRHIERDLQMKSLAKRGLDRREIADTVGVSISVVNNWAAANKEKVARLKSQKPLDLVGRDERICGLFSGGTTMGEIASQTGISRQRVHQILMLYRVDTSAGGRSLRTREKFEAKRVLRDKKSIEKYGVSYELLCFLRGIRAVAAYRGQRYTAKLRGVEFSMTLGEWWKVWAESGKYFQRGRSANSYVMSRIGDSGGYTVGNVEIKTSSENGREAVDQWLGKTKTTPKGVHEVHPGSTKPFLAKRGKKHLGYYKTVDGAMAARSAYIAAMSDAT